MNKVCISGRLIRDPELKSLENNNAVCTFFIANDVHFGTNKKTSFLKCTAWGNLGKIINDHAKQGTVLYITGRLEQNKYEDKDGRTVYDVSIIVEQFDFAAKAASADDSPNTGNNFDTMPGPDDVDKKLDDIPF